jgi:hypothetical protein
MASNNKFRGNVYNQPKPTLADELADVLTPAPQEPVQTAAASSEASTSASEPQDTPAPVQEAPQTSEDRPVAFDAPAAAQAAEETAPAPAAVIHLEQKAQARIMKSVERDLVSYMEAVHPKQAVNDEAGGAWQGSLFQTLKRILGNPDPEAFKTEWNTLLAFFHKHRDEMFNENFMFRFQSTWKGSAKDYTTFRHLVYLAIRTANPQTRQKEARDIVLDRITQGLSAQASTNLVNYYS